MPDIPKIIAVAIKEANTRYFFENYDIQAEAVIEALHEAGYKVVPNPPTAAMVKAGRHAIILGQSKSGKVVSAIYEEMVDSVKL